MTLAQFHHDVEEVHTVQLKLFAERRVVIKLAKVIIGCDRLKNVDDFLANVSWRHLRLKSVLKMVRNQRRLIRGTTE